MYQDKRKNIYEDLKEYTNEYNVINIVGDMNNLLDNSFSIPLKVKDYYFFNTNGLVGLDMTCYLSDNEKIIMNDYSVVVWFNAHRKS